jgi:hypothetical protein
MPKPTRSVWKYELEPGENLCWLPRGAEVLSAQAQYDHLCLWARVDPDAPQDQRRFLVVGTGHTLPAGKRLAFIATAQMHGGALVWHVFEAGAPDA